ncbi:MAG: RHS repeat protein [Desulfobacterales bacterium]|nr:RHS repeat protein [Desulfobacterales bacterium]
MNICRSAPSALPSDSKSQIHPPFVIGQDRFKEKQYPDGPKEVFNYDSAGNLTQKNIRAGESIVYAYDSLNRMTTKTTP